MGANKGLVPTKTWVLKTVQAKATREELTQAICARWAILPVRILSQRKERTTWLVESADDPPSDILQAGKELIFVEKYQQKKPQPRARGRSKSRNPREQPQKPRGETPRQGKRVSWNEPQKPLETRGASEGTAKMPFWSKRPMDPLTQSDSWATYEKSERRTSRLDGGGQSASSSGDPAALTRLAQAEQVIQRVEARQERTEHELGSLNALVN